MQGLAEIEQKLKAGSSDDVGVDEAMVMVKALIATAVQEGRIEENHTWMDKAAERELCDAKPSIRFIDFRDRIAALQANKGTE